MNRRSFVSFLAALPLVGLGVVKAGTTKLPASLPIALHQGGITIVDVEYDERLGSAWTTPAALRRDENGLIPVKRLGRL